MTKGGKNTNGAANFVKRRLRKKLRVGEFREDCFELAFQLDSALGDDGIHEAIDEFIAMIESRGLQFGGGGTRAWSGIVQGPPRGSATEEDRQQVLAWLEGHPRITQASAGGIRDGWYGWGGL